MARLFSDAEHPTYSGKAVAWLAAGILSKNKPPKKERNTCHDSDLFWKARSEALCAVVLGALCGFGIVIIL